MPKKTARVRPVFDPFAFFLSHKLYCLQAISLVLVAFWIYSPELHGGWLWDDNSSITNNSIVQRWSGLWQIWFQPQDLTDYFPLKFSVQCIQWHLWHRDTFGYHVTNVVLHLFSAFLLWRLFFRLGLRLAWFGALLFVIHPLMVESVAWISELKNTLSLPFLLLAMLSFLNYENERRQSDYFKSAIWFILAMLCKTSVVMFPFVLLLYLWWRNRVITRADLLRTGPFFLISLVLGIITAHFQMNHGLGTGFDMLQGSFFSRFINAGLILAFYFSKAVVPINLMPIYPQWAVHALQFSSFLPLLVLTGLAAWFWLNRDHWGRHAIFGFGFFLINVFLVLGLMRMTFMEISWTSDHFLYLPLIGLIGVCVAGIEWIYFRLSASNRPYILVLLGIWVGLLAFQSYSYAAKFRDSSTLWNYNLQKNPESFMPYECLGGAAQEEGKHEEAIAYFNRALELRPRYAELYLYLGHSLIETGKIDSGFKAFATALKLKPKNADAHFAYGIALSKEGRLSEAIDEYQIGLQLKPGEASGHNNLGNALMKTGQSTEAITQYTEALRLDPNNPLAHNNLGFLLMQNDRLEEAAEHFKKSIQLKPNLEPAYANLGDTLLKMNKPAEASVSYRTALNLDPNDRAAQLNLSRAEAMSLPDSKP